MSVFNFVKMIRSYTDGANVPPPSVSSGFLYEALRMKPPEDTGLIPKNCRPGHGGISFYDPGVSLQSILQLREGNFARYENRVGYVESINAYEFNLIKDAPWCSESEDAGWRYVQLTSTIRGATLRSLNLRRAMWGMFCRAHVWQSTRRIVLAIIAFQSWAEGQKSRIPEDKKKLIRTIPCFHPVGIGVITKDIVQDQHVLVNYDGMFISLGLLNPRAHRAPIAGCPGLALGT